MEVEKAALRQDLGVKEKPVRLQWSLLHIRFRSRIRFNICQFEHVTPVKNSYNSLHKQ